MKPLLFLSLLFLVCRTGNAQSAPKLLPFQGRLTDQNGVAVTNGVRLVQFKIYNVPTGGSPVWGGELHRTTVNGGLVNVMLGSKTPLTGIDFDKQLYLEITVDVSGPTGQPDNSITSADPPMLPRQVIFPVVFAKEAADSRLLNGYDWSAVFGVNDPINGKLNGTRIQTNTITALQIASNTITGGQIASNTITAQQLAGAIITSNQIVNGSISSTSLASGAVHTANIADGQVTLQKLAPLELGTSVGVGGVGLSATIDGFSTSSGTWVDVPGLSVTNVTLGRPVLIALIPGDQTNGASFIQVNGNGATDATVEFQFLINGVVASPAIISLAHPFGERLPPSCIQTICFPAAGTNRFSLQVIAGTSPNSIMFRATRLFAKEF